MTGRVVTGVEERGGKPEESQQVDAKPRRPVISLPSIIYLGS